MKYIFILFQSLCFVIFHLANFLLFDWLDIFDASFLLICTKQKTSHSVPWGKAGKMEVLPHMQARGKISRPGVDGANTSHWGILGK